MYENAEVVLGLFNLFILIFLLIRKSKDSLFGNIKKKLILSGGLIFEIVFGYGYYFVFDYERNGKFMLPFILITIFPLSIYFLKNLLDYLKMRRDFKTQNNKI